MRNVLLKSSMLLQAFEFHFVRLPGSIGASCAHRTAAAGFSAATKVFYAQELPIRSVTEFFQCRLEYF